MDFDLRKVAENIETATTEDLLDRMTVYRDGMEPAAVALLARELAHRGVTPEAIVEHERMRRERALVEPDGFVVRCSFCDRPAVRRAWTWHRPQRRWLAVLPQRLNFCEVHVAEYKLA